ncbi:MAG: hypothetical protein JJE46_13265 [Acidimicrobiia bacterium]|nr:hypothetical protein [Acidimicrobiia bacterium]
MVVALAVVGGALPSGADRTNPADRALDRAREAIHDYEFRGTVELAWHDTQGRHRETLPVVAVDGGLRVADGRVLQHNGRSWLRTDQRWTTLWSDSRDPKAPGISAKYDIARRRGPRIVGRTTEVLVIRHDRRVVERMAVDRETGMMLRRERFDDSGAPTNRVEFISLEGVHRRHGVLDVPRVADTAPVRMAEPPSGSHRSLGDGFVLVDSRRLPRQETQLRYSDGVFEASIFRRAGALDWDSLPSGGTRVTFGSVRARRYRTSVGSVLVWQSGQDTVTCVTDASGRDQAGIVTDLMPSSESGWSRTVRFVTSPFSWK